MGARGFDEFANAHQLVGAEVVPHEQVPWEQGWDDELFDIRLARFASEAATKQQWGDQSAKANAGDKRDAVAPILGSVAVRALADRSPRIVL